MNSNKVIESFDAAANDTLQFSVASHFALAEFRRAVKIKWKAIKFQGKLTRDKCFNDVLALFLPTRLTSAYMYALSTPTDYDDPQPMYKLNDSL